MKRSSLSPQSFLIRAALLAAAFAVCHVLGYRAYTGFLCGMQSFAGESSTMASLKGLLYVMSYIGAVVIAPIFALAAGILRAIRGPPEGGTTSSP